MQYMHTLAILFQSPKCQLWKNPTRIILRFIHSFATDYRTALKHANSIKLCGAILCVASVFCECPANMFKSRNESNIVYKCTVRLLEDVDVLECEFQVWCTKHDLYSIWRVQNSDFLNKFNAEPVGLNDLHVIAADHKRPSTQSSS